MTDPAPEEKRKERIVMRLDEWGINKKTVGPIILAALVAEILHILGVLYTGMDRDFNISKAKVNAVMTYLQQEGYLAPILEKVTERKLRDAFESIMNAKEDILSV